MKFYHEIHEILNISYNLLLRSTARYSLLTHLCPPLRSTFAVRETDVSRHNGGTSGAPLKPLRDDSALRALSSQRGLRGASEVPPLCRETSVFRTANVGTWLRKRNGGQKWVNQTL